ncbi:MAG: hypothetical protein KKA42_09990 [candidate division Zixibacteria bacterium]|nr:hypothetical protein [candidate division Zixibacteria bacterium]
MKASTVVLLLLALAGLFAACGEKTADKTAPAASTDEQRIQDVLDEVVARWHNKDKAVLYDLEFPYLRDQFTFDEYLRFPQIEWMNADSVRSIKALDFVFYDRDSADALVEVVLVDPAGGDTSIVNDRYRFYYHRDRWIRPTVSTSLLQYEYDRDWRAADSAAAAEAELEDL